MVQWTRLEMEFANPITTFHFADTNGNGFSEILVSESRSDGVVVRQREFDGVNWTAPFGESFGYFFNLTTQNTGLIEPEDVNGDGIIDIVFAIDFVKTGSQEYKSRAGYMLGEGEGQYDSPDYFYEYNTYAHDYRHIQSADMNGDGSPDPLLHFWAEGLNVNFAEDEYDNISYFVNDFNTTPSIDTADISTVCHSANTYDTAEDDYLLLKMMVKETFAGTKYIVDASNATIEPPLAVYDEKHNFRVYPTTSEDLEITVTDITNPSLSLTFTLENTLSCSDFSQLVSFEINNVSCSDNETPNNLDDDIINFELLIESSTFSGEYVLNAENLEEATGNYNVVSSFASITGAAGAGDLNISLTDASNEDLTLSLTIEDTGVCSVSSTETSDFLQNIQLRENPVSDYLRFSYRNFARSSDYKLVVRDLNGIMKHEQALSGDFLSISAITWNTGLYVYSIENKENGEFVSTGKFVKL